MLKRLFYAGIAVTLMAACKQNAPATGTAQPANSLSCLEPSTATSINTNIYMVSAPFGLPRSQNSNSCYAIAAEADTAAYFEIKVDTTGNATTPFNYVRWATTDLVQNLQYFDLKITPSTNPGYVNVVLKRTALAIPTPYTNTEIRVTIICGINSDPSQTASTDPQPTAPHVPGSILNW